jgi:acyl-coenzyme A synthetase/AMP-(fatty) acid ligase
MRYADARSVSSPALLIDEMGTADASSLVRRRDDLRGAAVIVVCRAPRRVLSAMLSLDGTAARIVLVPASMPPEQVRQHVRGPEVHVEWTDSHDPPADDRTAPTTKVAETEWVLLTSGTTATPRAVSHTFASLSRTVGRAIDNEARWGLLYDPARFAGLQVVLQATLRGGTLIMPDLTSSLERQVELLREHGCTHLSATPSLWRRILMVKGATELPLRQVTLGGEIADDQILHALRRAFPQAKITHIYASTEAGVGFSVKDGRAGFPVEYLNRSPSGVDLDVRDGILWLRPPAGSAGSGASVVIDQAGFVRSGDVVSVTEDRVRFLGREGGVVSVGGYKVHPERVEGTIAAVPGVRLVRVMGRSSPLLGSVLIADVVPAPDGVDLDALRAAIKAHCAEALERAAQPAQIRFVDALELTTAGKASRR